MSAQCAAGSSKLDEHVRKPTWGCVHVGPCRLWESDLVRRKTKPTGVSWAPHCQCQAVTFVSRITFLGKLRSVQWKWQVMSLIWVLGHLFSTTEQAQWVTVASRHHLQSIYIVSDCQRLANELGSHFIPLNTERESIERTRLTLISLCTVLWKALRGLVGWC